MQHHGPLRIAAPFRNRLYLACKNSVKGMLDRVQDSKEGCLWWYGISRQGRYTRVHLVRRWTQMVYPLVYPPALLRMLLQTALTETGAIDARGRALYTWLLTQVYNGSVEALYADWLGLRDEQARWKEMP